MAVSHKNDVAYSKTLLLNSEKIGDIQSNGSYADFYYAAYGTTTWKFTTSALTKDQLVALAEDSTLYASRLELPMLGKSMVRKVKLATADLFSSTTAISVAASKFIQGYDIDVNTSYCLFELGEKTILYKVDDVIANIESASSTSVSIY